MTEFISINKHSKKGDLVISRKVIEEITDEAVLRVLNSSTKDSKKVKIASPTKISVLKDGKVNVNIIVTLKKGTNPEQICLKIQEEVANDLATYTESLPFEIEISIADIK